MDRLSWSRTGHIAYIVYGKVYITWLRCIDGGSWKLADPVPVPAAGNIVHVSWASGTDFAVVDEQGKVQIFEFSASGTVEPRSTLVAPTDTRSRPTELDSVVRTYWLGSERLLALPSSVPPLPTGGNTAPGKPVWESIRPQGPAHPVPAGAGLLSLTRNGLLRLLIEQSDRTFKEVSVPLEATNSIVRAAFVPHQKSLMLAAYFSCGTIGVYKVDLEFSSSLTAQFVDGSTPPAMISAIPVSSINIDNPSGTWVSTFEFVRMPAPTPGPEGSAPVVELHTVFSKDNESLIAVYRLLQRPQPLHPSLIKRFGPTAGQSAPEWKLTAAPWKNAPQRIKSIIVTRTALLTYYCDGTIESTNLLSTATVMPGATLGFDDKQTNTFAKAESIAVSQNLCMVISLDSSTLDALHEEPSKKKPLVLPELEMMKCVAPELDTPKAVELATTIATSYAFSVFNIVQSDDLLCVTWNLLHRSLKQLKINPVMFMGALSAETQRLLNVSFEPPEDPRQVDRTSVIPSPLQRWLIFQLVLGTGQGWQRNASAQLAWAALNAQLIVFSVTWTLKIVSQPSKAQTQQEKLNEITAHSYQVMNILGLVRWVTDLVAHLSREVFLATNVKDDPSKPRKPGPQGQIPSAAAMHLASTPSSFVNIMLSKILRFLLVFALRGLRGLDQITQKLVEQEQILSGEPGVAAMIGKRFQDIVSSAPVTLPLFERVLSDIEKHLKSIYTNDKVQDRVKQALEMELLKNVRTPQVLQPIIGHIVSVFESQVIGAIDVPNLYFYDTEWLSLDKAGSSHTDRYDVIGKKLITAQDRARLCTRCGMYSFQDHPKLAHSVEWTLLFSRMCVCGGLWQPCEPQQTIPEAVKEEP